MLFALLRHHTYGPSVLPFFITPPPSASYLMVVRNAAFSDAFQSPYRLVLLVHAHRHVWFLLLSIHLSKTSSRTCMNISVATEVRFLHRCLANGSWSGTLERGEQGPIFKVFSRYSSSNIGHIDASTSNLSGDRRVARLIFSHEVKRSVSRR